MCFLCVADGVACYDCSAVFRFQKFGVPDDVVSVEQQMEEEEEQLAIIALVQLDEGVVER